MGVRTFVLCAMLLGAQALAADSGQRYELTGSGALVLDAPAQGNARFSLKADLSSKQRPSIAATPLAGGRFVLSALASSNSLVCYNDTIFRDSFDGTGL
jgi:hypothetical protein